jgi:hypothetical protein
MAAAYSPSPINYLTILSKCCFCNGVISEPTIIFEM